MAIKDPCVALIKCRLQTPHLYEPYTDKYGKTMYSCILRVYDKAEWAKIEAGKRAACQKKFGVDATRSLRRSTATQTAACFVSLTTTTLTSL